MASVNRDSRWSAQEGTKRFRVSSGLNYPGSHLISYPVVIVHGEEAERCGS
jgi:hypothetical protein